MARIYLALYLLTGLLLDALWGGGEASPPIIHYSHNMRILKIPTITEPGSIVYRIKATDSDNEEVFFGILEDFGKNVLRFEKIHYNEANVILASPLKPNDQFNLTIFATDNNESTYIESRLLATEVPNLPTTEQAQSLNPILLTQNPVYVYENETLNKSITEVKAYDRNDSKLPIIFELVQNENVFEFRYIFGPRGISTAEIVLQSQLDYERQNMYTLTLLAINARTNEEVDTRNVHSVKLSIVVQDVQDTPPVFVNLPHYLPVENHRQAGEILFNVSAHDGDTVNRRNLTFSILKPHNEYFNVANNGSVWMTSSATQLSTIIERNLPIRVLVQANEVLIDEMNTETQTTSSVAELIICLTNTNRKPMPKADHLVGHIAEHSAVHSAVIWQSAQMAIVLDPDDNWNGTIQLELFDFTRSFLIEPTSAYKESVITLLVNDSSLLDYEARSNLTVMVEARDKSKEDSMAVNITCTIIIDDINDNYPQFSKSIYQVSVLENSPEGTVIAQITATDKDDGDYGIVRYTAIRGSFASNLHLDPISGIVTLINGSALDRELVAEYMLTIEARDDRGKGNANTTELYIEVLDLNDNAPIFLQPNYIGLLNSDQSQLLLPLQLTAIDIDQANSNNSLVNYEILHGNYENVVQIDQRSGIILPVKPPAGGGRKMFAKYEPVVITVRAYDLGIPQQSSTTKVYLYTMNNPNIVQGLFISKRRLLQHHDDQQLEKYLNYITGGNVSVHAVTQAVQGKNGSSILAVIEYGNQSIVNLDSLPSTYRSLVGMDKSDIESETELIPGEDQTRAKIINQENQVDNFTRKDLRTTQFGNLDLILWIMIFLILLLFVILIYLLCLICNNRRKNVSKITIDTQTKPQIRRRVLKRKRNVGNKVLAIPKNYSQEQVIETLFADKSNRKQLLSADEYHAEEERKYMTSPSGMAYYEFKRLQYPKNKKINSNGVISMMPEKKFILAQNDSLDRQLTDSSTGSVQKERTMEAKTLQVTLPKRLAAVENATSGDIMSQPMNSSQVDLPSSITKEQKYSTLNDDKHEPSLVDAFGKDKVHTDRYQAMLPDRMMRFSVDSPHHDRNDYRKPKQVQRKSIFTIAYDQIGNRENISAGSDKGN